MDKTKTVAIICIVGFVLVAGILVFTNKEKLFAEKAVTNPTTAPTE